ncbi:MAG: VCBS repeat-containing protein [Candidatus Hydrogenedentes bacterium]|nr:VCBS repeat-containing protein [Candidatus Hydrogenedentota bacterium]
MANPACHNRGPGGPRGRARAALVLALCALAAAPAGAADKNGVSLRSVSLPSGPGSISGLGGEFEPDLPNGFASYEVPILVPAGANGMAPEVVLSYVGGVGNGILGFGWDMVLPFVRLSDDRLRARYSPGLKADEYFVTDEHDTPDYLVLRDDGYYFGSNEGAFIRYERMEDHWEGTRPDGTVMVFGRTPAGRIENPTGEHVYQWNIEEERDVYGNTVRYVYQAMEGRENLNQKYLVRIEYGAGPPPWDSFHFVSFEYGARTDWSEDGWAGFPVRTGLRMTAILVCTQGVELPGHEAGDRNADGVTDYLNRRYLLSYGAHPHWTLLDKVAMYGADGQSLLPPLTMAYTASNLSDSLSAAGRQVHAANAPTVLFDKDYVEITDLNGDALPDILKTEPFGGAHTAYMNLGQHDENGVKTLRFADGVPVGGDARAYSVNLSESANAPAHLQDMDGDGRADLVYTASTYDVYYFTAEVKDGVPYWGDRRPMNPLRESAAPPSPFVAERTEYADINGDDMGDIFQSVHAGGKTALRVWLNLEGDRFAPFYTVPQDFTFHLGEEGVSVAEFNGDELPDIVRVTDSMIEVATGLGYGEFSEVVQVPIPGGNFLKGEAALEDIDGNGLDDLVILWPVANTIHYYLNLGNYTLDHLRVITDVPGFVAADAALRVADMNGNGTADLVYADRLAGNRLTIMDIGELMGCVPAPNLLTRVDNGIGRVMRLEYLTTTDYALADAAAGTPWRDPLPSVSEVVSAMIVEDSFGGEYVTRFEYHDGVYNRPNRLFVGFEKVVTREIGDDTAPTRVTRHTYNTGRDNFPLRGMLLEESVEGDDGAVYSVESKEYATPLLFTGPDGSESFAPYESVTVRTLVEGGAAPPKTVRTETVQDEYGNETELREWGIVEGDDFLAGGDERITRMEYALNLDAWIIHAPSRIEILDGEHNPLTLSLLYYDDETYSAENYGEVVRGGQTLEVGYYDLEDPEGYVLSERVKYDAYGNVVAALDEMAEAPGGVIDDGVGHYRTFTFDPHFRTFPTGETVHVGGDADDLEVSAEYDFGLGTVLAGTDFNGLWTFYTHDPFGRLLSTMRPGDTEDYPSLAYQYVQGAAHGDGVVNYVETRLLDRVPGSEKNAGDHYFISREYMDGMGRPLMKREEADPDPDTGAPRVAVSGAAGFNARAGVAFELSPYFESGAAGGLDALLDYRGIQDGDWSGLFLDGDTLADRTIADAPRVSTVYDPLLREIEVVNPDGSLRRQRHEPLAIFRFDENDCDPESPHFDTPLVHHSDGLGRLARVDETARLNDDGTPADEKAVWSTLYTYRADGPLLSMTDAQGNVRQYGYDALQTLNFIDDPNRGHIYRETDNVGNTAAIEDAAGRRIEHTYDGANRTLTMDFLDEDEDFSAGFSFDPELPPGPDNRPDVVYGYDAAFVPWGGKNAKDGGVGAGDNARGLPSYVLYPHGEYHYGYTERGDLARTLHRMDDPLTGVPVDFLTEVSHDPAGRMVSMTYPDGDRVAYQYSARGSTARIDGGEALHAGGSPRLFEALDFSPAGQWRSWRLGNGVVMAGAYDIRGRLSRISADAAAPGPPLLDLAYAFDGVSNILAVDDLRPAEARPDGDPLRNSRRFSYDDLDRLAGALYSFAPPEETFRQDASVSYRHDRIGNLLEQRSDWVQEERGRPVADLGLLGYGGGAGASDRQGRAPDDPPGPGALTSIERDGEVREFPYDAAGNMTRLDGLDLTWDYRNMPVSAEDGAMRAEYRYDHAGRRVAKLVWEKDGNGDPSPVPVQTVLYAGEHFEMRENDQQTKYVYDSEGGRLAKVTGMLDSGAPRTQRFRISQGWNLFSMAVGAEDAAAQFGVGVNPSIGGAFLLDPATEAHTPLDAETPLPLGGIFWVYGILPDMVSVTGTVPAGNPQTLDAGAGFHTVTGFEAIPLAELVAGETETAWLWDAGLGGWKARPGGALAFLADAPDFVRPGQPLFIRVSADTPLSPPPASASIEYYLKDHLDTACLILDGAGRVVEERTFHPYGAPRSEFRARPATLHNPYQFAGKERDRESGLQYFEARYLENTSGRFLSPDPVSNEFPDEYLADPQMQTAYGFARANPLVYEDPTGLFLETALAKKKINSLNPFGNANVSDAKLTKAERIAEVFGNLNIKKGGTLPKGLDLGGIKIHAFVKKDIKEDLAKMNSPEQINAKIAQVAENLKNLVPQKGKDKVDVSQFLNLFTKERPIGPLQEGVQLTEGGRVIITGKEQGSKLDTKEILKQIEGMGSFKAKYKELKGIAEKKGLAGKEFKFDPAKAAAFYEKFLQPISGGLFEDDKKDSDDDNDSDSE